MQKNHGISKSIPFKIFIGMLFYKDYANTRDAIIEHCGINAQIFKNWRTGRTKIPAEHLEFINSLASKYDHLKIFKVH